MLKLDLSYNKNILFITLEGQLNRMTSYKINNFLVPSILKHHIKYGVLDLKNLKAIDEEGMDSLLNIKSAFKSNKGLLFLHEYNNEIIKKISKLRIKKVKSLDMMGAK